MSFTPGPSTFSKRYKTQTKKRRNKAEETHLKLPPQATLTAADTVHDPGDVFKMEAEFLLGGQNGRRRQTEVRARKVSHRTLYFIRRHS